MPCLIALVVKLCFVLEYGYPSYDLLSQIKLLSAMRNTSKTTTVDTKLFV